MKTVVVLDYGSQYTQLIVRRVREKGYYAELLPWDAKEEEVKRLNPTAIILSGGPSSVYEKDAPFVPEYVLHLNIPILGICYGLQALVHKFGGRVEKSQKREFGHAILEVEEDPLFEGLPKKFDVWMSHSDRVEKLPEGFYVIGRSENSPFAAIRNKNETIYGVQFHPEVTHTQFGSKILENFVSKIAKMEKNWEMKDFVSEKIKEIKGIVGNDKVILGLSGGVDSSVVAMLLHKAIGDNLVPVFVDTGLLRLNEGEEVKENFERLGIKIFVVDAKKRFLDALKDVEDPEEKRKIIGHTFIDVFYETSMQLLEEFGNIKYLAQGTLYPDIIESKVSERKSAAKIKTHHNVGGLPEKLPFKIIEPLRYLFKDEVRKIGEILELPQSMINRHPFPGPGLAVRIIGKVTEEAISILQKADYIFIEELKKNNLYDKVWQAFAVFLPIKSVGVMGDYRTYENVIALRAVNSFDGMTADWSKLPHEFLNKVAKRIINEVKGVNRVVYDITSKPPATIEWE
ncbi:GMP synthase [Thermosipho melanesiensis]|uniref:GMP synthase [glutamine-hydrolyzing] n=2 Tax=Thermosipho melanesiensis TaxID=46541 RepID=GUAA_THEM4|nr:glutamine-hydrolyzing GMP synthase [Thermosipho melanesiensis]A6LKY1.1 RecName: Full=GMP synthase [glutamine-hydrolyzing]; AltName: Full=GMP synthetase; AltName: Full=Glutamine amidotransferase [Thermosipho melanesiensis BI429]ABR30582.1 GMP synthase, large subunit [Thermosipho melanesiensis BI429]APT73730.1 GMP synthase [Thermosipho melanesiensis]OOC35667.1 GMP synthase [Thermosipho melanesiensis]OOC38966.1 GMP synthase [Thermosipho melanesiensis]OOC39114.1 GMP synthase [Thermosipho melan